MIVPKYWAEGKIQKRYPDGKQVTIRRFGWSDENQDDAQACADKRASEALKLKEQGERVARYEPKVPYNGADGVPIREEILQQQGALVITRNSYGAKCLNSPDLLIADVDLDHRENELLGCIIALVSLLAGIAYGIWSGSFRDGVIAGGVTGITLQLIKVCYEILKRWIIDLRGGVEKMTKSKVIQFCEQNTKWKVRLYQTPAGMRLIVTHQRFTPAQKEVELFFKHIKADPVYVRMCLLQKCFRARLTAKPWRIGIDSHMKPRPGVWPVAENRRVERQKWIDNYELVAVNYAACSYIESVGTGRELPEILEDVELHDQLSHALTDKKLA